MESNGSRHPVSEWDTVATTRDNGEPIRILIADHDPISRRVVDGVLRGSRQLDVVASIDSHRPFAEWPIRHVDVAVLSLSGGDLPAATIRELTARAIRVLLIGMDWTRGSLDIAVAAGAAGCVVKDTELTGIVAGVQAIAHGNAVFSPELVSLYVPCSDATVPHHRPPDVVLRLSDREREVLMLLGDGMSTAEAAKACGVSNATIKSHVSHSLGKLGARSRLEAVLIVKGAFTPVRWTRLRPPDRVGS
jgi:two-component system nitrate/nitrite response regulator NarL